MGNKRQAASGLASALFSTVQQRVLALLFRDPDHEYSTLDIIRMVDSGSGAVQRELGRLAASGIVTKRSVGNQRRYRADRTSPVFNELHGLVLKTVGLVEPIRAALEKFGDQIRVAFVYGSIAKGQDKAKSDIDLMIIGDRLAYSNIFAALQDAERIVGRPINPNLMSSRDWQSKLARKTAFVEKIAAQPKLIVIGSEDALERA